MDTQSADVTYEAFSPGAQTLGSLELEAVRDKVCRLRFATSSQGDGRRKRLFAPGM